MGKVELSGTKWIFVDLRCLPQSPRMGFPLYQKGNSEVRMTTHFRGRFEIKVDPKFRLILPAPFREVVKLTSDSRMVITNSQYQGKRCLDVYPFAEWKKLEVRIAKLPQLKVEVQNFQRFYLSGGHPIEADANGRVLVPPTLRSYANIQTDIVLVGFANK